MSFFLSFLADEGPDTVLCVITNAVGELKMRVKLSRRPMHVIGISFIYFLATTIICSLSALNWYLNWMVSFGLSRVLDYRPGAGSSTFSECPL